MHTGCRNTCQRIQYSFISAGFNYLAICSAWSARQEKLCKRVCIWFDRCFHSFSDPAVCWFPRENSIRKFIFSIFAILDFPVPSIPSRVISFPFDTSDQAYLAIMKKLIFFPVHIWECDNNGYPDHNQTELIDITDRRSEPPSQKAG